MADNLGIHTGTDATIATDDISSAHYQKVKIVSGKTDSTTGLRGDDKTGAFITIDYAHHEAHEGDAFTASHTEDLGNGVVRDILIVTPNTAKWAHLTWFVEGELETHIGLYEAPTATAAANPIVAYNRDRNSAVTSGLVITHTPTSITIGTTLIREAHFGTGKNAGGSRAESEEFILKQNTKYILRVTNSTSSNNYVAIRLDWYEHQNL
jgi:hypothetical protein